MPGAGVESGEKLFHPHQSGTFTQEHGIYDPCAQVPAWASPRKNFESEELEGIEGLHFHTLCEQNSDALVEVVQAVEEKFGPSFIR